MSELEKARVKGHYRTVRGKRMWVPEYVTKTPAAVNRLPAGPRPVSPGQVYEESWQDYDPGAGKYRHGGRRFRVHAVEGGQAKLRETHHYAHGLGWMPTVGSTYETGEDRPVADVGKLTLRHDPESGPFARYTGVETVHDVPEEATLVTDSQEIDDILQGIGSHYTADDFGCLFALVGEGEYEAIWGCEHSVPWLDEPVEVLYPPEAVRDVEASWYNLRRESELAARKSQAEPDDDPHQDIEYELGNLGKSFAGFLDGLRKGYVRGHYRTQGGQRVYVKPHSTKRTKRMETAPGITPALRREYKEFMVGNEGRSPAYIESLTRRFLTEHGNIPSATNVQLRDLVSAWLGGGDTMGIGSVEPGTEARGGVRGISRPGPNQTVLHMVGGGDFLFSYETPVAARLGTGDFVAERVYSSTTSRHITAFLGGAVSGAEKISEERFAQLAGSVGALKTRVIGANEVEVSFGPDMKVLFSYATPVAARIGGKYYRAGKRYSTTTSAHVNKWLAGNQAEEVSPEYFQGILGGAEAAKSLYPYVAELSWEEMLEKARIEPYYRIRGGRRQWVSGHIRGRDTGPRPLEQPGREGFKILPRLRSMIARNFGPVWESADREEAFNLCNQIREQLDVPPYSPAKFDEGWQHRTIFDEDYDVAKDEFLNLVFGWW